MCVSMQHMEGSNKLRAIQPSAPNVEGFHVVWCLASWDKRSR
jgi:hypothetical protein